jgi:phenylalanine-4-hydroxylase
MIPVHLRRYVAAQDPSLYTPIDHAAWRFILRVGRAFLATAAHPAYLRGLEATGVPTDRIPLIREMDERLQKLGWRAVAVTGFVPPAAFLELQSLGVLAIACDMRPLEQLAYTPAPDIVHEAAGHAPLLADPEYSAYLRSYGRVARNAILSQGDLEVYAAIRRLSDLKQDARSSPSAVAAAQEALDDACARQTHVSEASWLSRMAWWTTEYGLVGPADAPVIYGAGLLSSVGESQACFGAAVRKVPFSLDCINFAYDITRPQPHLFVTPDFATLRAAIEELADKMAFRRGGVESLEKARLAGTTTTTVLDSGLQISGTLADYEVDAAGEVKLLRHEGPTQLAFEDREIAGHGAAAHPGGFVAPLGRLRDGRAPWALSDGEWRALGQRVELASGIVLEGAFVRALRVGGRALVVTFRACTVRDGARTLNDAGRGLFHLACGAGVPSVFGGAADRERFPDTAAGEAFRAAPPKSNLTEANRALNELYGRVRKLREAGTWPRDGEALAEIHAELEARYPNDWLLRWELLELCSGYELNSAWAPVARERLAAIAQGAGETGKLIERGLSLLRRRESPDAGDLRDRPPPKGTLARAGLRAADR